MGETKLDGAFIDLREIATPPNPAADVGRMYVKDVSSVTTLFFRDNAGNETDLLAMTGEIATWTEDHSMATFKLTATSTNDVILNAPTGQAVSIEVDAVEQYSFDVAALTMNNNNLIMGSGLIRFGTGEEISMQSNDMIFDVTTGDFFSFDIAGTPEYVFDVANANWNGNNIINLSSIAFDDSNTTITQAATDLQIDVATGGAQVFRVNNTPEYDFDSTRADFLGNNLVGLGGVTMNDAANNRFS